MQTASTLDAARECGFYQSALVELGTHLPIDDAALDTLMADAVRGRDEFAFVRLMFACVGTHRAVDAKHLLMSGDDPGLLCRRPETVDLQVLVVDSQDRSHLPPVIEDPLSLGVELQAAVGQGFG